MATEEIIGNTVVRVFTSNIGKLKYVFFLTLKKVPNILRISLLLLLDQSNKLMVRTL